MTSNKHNTYIVAVLIIITLWSIIRIAEPILNYADWTIMLVVSYLTNKITSRFNEKLIYVSITFVYMLLASLFISPLGAIWTYIGDTLSVDISSLFFCFESFIIFLNWVIIMIVNYRNQGVDERQISINLFVQIGVIIVIWLLALAMFYVSLEITRLFVLG